MVIIQCVCVVFAVCATIQPAGKMHTGRVRDSGIGRPTLVASYGCQGVTGT